VETEANSHGREIISIDLSEYADPLHMRMIRIPFSVYHKPQQKRDVLGNEVVDALPLMFSVPLFETDVREGCRLMRDPRRSADLARIASARIPDQTEGTGRLAEAYLRSPLAGCHRWFYEQEHDPPERWPETYDRTPWEPLSACARHILEHPNDLLLRLAAIRHLVRVMLALGWHPRHIAGLIRSKYERDYGWGLRFYRYDAANRADFYVRLFTGLVALGRDDLRDFEGRAVGALRSCAESSCDPNIAGLKRSLIARRDHERLACRPFNRLFSPDEHS
jgi:hypothetical protein